MSTKTLSLFEIRDLKGLNVNIIKEYISLAEKRLDDVLEIKKELEQKSFTLLGGYITASLSLFGLALKLVDYSFWLNATAILFCCGVIPLFLSLKTSLYGIKGRSPSSWLETEDYLTVERSGSGEACVYAYILHGYIPRIDQSIESNGKKSFYLNIAIWFGVLSLTPFVIKLLFCL
jgi:hypothetical protein